MKGIMLGLSVALSILLAGLVAGCCGTCRQCERGQAACASVCHVKAPVAEIGTPALSALLASGAPVVVLDARTGKFDDGRRIPGAKLLAPDATAEQAKAMIPSKDALVVTYCAGLKCKASSVLGANLRALGFGNVLEYHEGIEGWVKAGHEVKIEK